jgi:hypothetical protein
VAGGFDLVALRHDVVTVEYRAGLVAGHRHRYALGYSGLLDKPPDNRRRKWWNLSPTS